MVNLGVTFLVFHCKSNLLSCAGNYGNSTRIDANHKPKAPMDVFPRYNPNGSSYIRYYQLDQSRGNCSFP